jgi:hypothetical protein
LNHGASYIMKTLVVGNVIIETFEKTEKGD